MPPLGAEVERVVGLVLVSGRFESVRRVWGFANDSQRLWLQSFRLWILTPSNREGVLRSFVLLLPLQQSCSRASVLPAQPQT